MDGFFGISIARRALEASQYGMDTAAHNIANANTPGFTRRRVILGTTEPFPAPSFNRPLLQGQLGSGVKVRSIERVRDGYFDGQMRKESQNQGFWEVKDNALKQLETILGEPSEAGLQNLMGEFWNAWQQLSKNSESTSVRTSMLESGRMLTTTFNQLSYKLSQLQANLNEQVKVKVAEVNNITQRISELNHDILGTTTFGMQPNDSLDERDLLIDQLSKIVEVQVNELDSGVVVINLNGTQLVNQYSATELTVVPNAANKGYYDVKSSIDNLSITMVTGELKSLINSRDVVVPEYQNQLDILASTLITQVNAAHQAGFGLDGVSGYSFFTGTNASDIALHSDVSDVGHIAASGTAAGVPGDNANAVLLAQLKDKLVLIGGNNTTMGDYYRSIITDLGIESQESARMAENSQLYIDLIESHRQSVSGVSLDEETTNMIKYQKAYEAAARVITVFDEMLDTLINRMIR